MGHATDNIASSAKPHPAAQLHARPARSVRLMQDVVSPAKQAHKAAKGRSSAPAKKAAARPAKPAPANSIKHHKTQTPQTLMRRSVSKPSPGLKRQLTISTPAGAQPAAVRVLPKGSVNFIDLKRANRSLQVKKSQLIQRYAPDNRSWFSGHEAAAVKVTKPTAIEDVTAAAPKASMDIFQKAIDHASAHQQLPVDARQQAKAARKLARARKPVHHRLPTILAITFAVLLTAGFVLYQQRTPLTLRFASAKAGFHAILPTYRPSGYAAAKFRYTSGSVAVDFTRSGTSRMYDFSQTTSTIDSQTLKENIAGSDKTYQTVENRGRTIFLYGNNNAAWVDGGILYSIVSNGNLSTSDLLSIVGSV